LYDASNVVTDVRWTPNVDLACGEKDVYADVDEQAALNFASDSSSDDLALVDRLHHLLPSDNLLGLSLAQRNHAMWIISSTKLILQIFDQYLKRLTYLRRIFIFFPFATRNAAFALEAHVDQDNVVIDPNDASFNDRIDVKAGFTLHRSEDGTVVFDSLEFLIKEGTDGCVGF